MWYFAAIVSLMVGISLHVLKDGQPGEPSFFIEALVFVLLAFTGAVAAAKVAAKSGDRGHK